MELIPPRPPDESPPAGSDKSIIVPKVTCGVGGHHNIAGNSFIHSFIRVSLKSNSVESGDVGRKVGRMTSVSARALDANTDSLFVLAGFSAGLVLKANVKV